MTIVLNNALNQERQDCNLTVRPQDQILIQLKERPDNTVEVWNPDMGCCPPVVSADVVRLIVKDNTQVTVIGYYGEATRILHLNITVQ